VAPADATPPAAASLPPGPELWHAVRGEISAKYPLQSGYAAEASFLRVEGGKFVIGVPEEHRLAAANLERPNLKKAMEDALCRLSGQKFSLRVEVSAEITAAPAPAPTAPAVLEKPVEPENLPGKKGKAAAANEAAASAAQREEEFQNDPLIQEALRLFDAKIAQSA
jgi:DNA polymerase-3 subunit gamma/tau